MSRITKIENKPPLGKLISTRLKEMEKSQKWLAANINMNYAYLNRVVRGRCTPSLCTLKKISKSLDISLRELVNALVSEG